MLSLLFVTRPTQQNARLKYLPRAKQQIISSLPLRGRDSTGQTESVARHDLRSASWRHISVINHTNAQSKAGGCWSSVALFFACSRHVAELWARQNGNKVKGTKGRRDKTRDRQTDGRLGWMTMDGWTQGWVGRPSISFLARIYNWPHTEHTHTHTHTHTHCRHTYI